MVSVYVRLGDDLLDDPLFDWIVGISFDDRLMLCAYGAPLSAASRLEERPQGDDR
jgi:hypothetical protein